MSKTIDERVVSMQFDNSNFERNISKSESSLNKFKESLQFKDASKGFNNLENESKKVTFSGLISGITNVSNQFSALDILGTAALWNLAEQAVQAGERIVKAMTIDPITTGFNEYELKMGSIQTMMASTGESLETVNAYLDELNKYSDQTIYSFSDMTNSIGKFTNAGVSLKDAVAAIKGVSNEAALSGANANEASRAMYNFAQALSAGYVKLIDWKSIENANMATVSFKEELLKTAVACGTVAEAGDGMYQVLTQSGANSSMDDTISAVKNFNDSLQYQWMTKDVLIQTLSKYADAETEIGKKAYAAAQDIKTFSMMIDTLTEAAQSGWAETWEIIIGDFLEAKTFWTALSEPLGNVIAKTAEARNTLVRGIMETNWEKFTRQVTDSGTSILDFSNAIIEASGHSDKLSKMVTEVGSLSAALKSNKNAQSWITADVIINALDSVANKYRTVMQESSELTAEQKVAYLEQADALDVLKAKVQETGSVVNLLVSDFGFNKGGRDYLIGMLQNIVNLFNQISDIAKNGFIRAFSDENGLFGGRSIIREFIKLLYDSTSVLSLNSAQVEVLTKVVQSFFTILRTFAYAGGSVFLTFLRSIGTLATTAASPLFTLLDHLSTLILRFDAYIQKQQWIEKANLAVATAMEKAAEAVKSYALAFWHLDQIQNIVKRFEKYKEEFYEYGTQMIAGLKYGIKDGGKEALDYITEFFKNILETVRKILGIHSPSTEFFDMAVNCISGWIKGWVSEATGLSKSVIGAIQMMVKKLKEFFDMTSGKDLIAGGFTIGIFYLINKLLSIFTNFGPVLEGFANVLGASAKTISTIPRLIKAKALEANANAILKLAEAIAILAGALVLMSTVDPIKLLAPVGALVVIVGSLAFLIAKIGKLNTTISSSGASGFQAASLLTIAASLYVVSLAFLRLSKIPKEEILKTIVLYTTICVSLLGLMTAIGFLSKKGLTIGDAATVKAFASILAIATGLMMMSLAIKTLSLIKPETALKSLPAMIEILLSMLAIAGIINKFPVRKKAFVEFGLLMIEFGAAMLLLAVAIKALNSITWSEFTNAGAKMLLLIPIFAALTVVSNLGKTGMMAKVGVMFAGFGVAMLALSFGIKILANIDTDDVDKGKKTLWSVVGMFAALLGVISLATHFAGAEMQFIRIGIMISTIAGAMTMLVGALYTLSLINEAGLERARTTILMLGGMFSVLVLAASRAVSAMPVIIAATAAISVMVVLLVGLTHIPVKDLNRALLAFGTIMVSFIIMLRELSAVAKIAKGLIKNLAILVAVIALLGLIFAGLSALIKNTEIAKTVSDAILKIAISLTVAMVAMAVLSATAEIAIPGLIAATAVIIAITALLAAFGYAASKWSGLEKQIEKGGKLLSLIGEAIGSFFGSMVSGFATSGINKVAKALTEFADDIQPFLKTIGNLRGDIFDKVKILFKSIKTLVDASNDFSKKNIRSLGNELDRIAEPIVEFVGKLKGIRPAPAEKAVKILTILTAAGTDSSKESIKALRSVTGLLPSIGSNLADLITSINAKGVNDKTIKQAQTAVDIIQVLADAANSLPAQGGTWQRLAGTKDIATFVKETMPEIAIGLNKLYANLDSETLANVDVISNVANCISTIISSFSNIKNTGGKWQNIFGEWDPTAFMKSLAKFGKPLGEFYQSVKGIDIDTKIIDDVCKAIKSLSALVTDKTMSGLNIQSNGPTPLENISKILPKLGQAIGQFLTSLAPFSVEAMEQAVSIFNALTKFGKVEFDPKNIQSLTKAVSDMANKIGSMDPETIAAFAKNMTDITTALINFVNSGVNAETFTSTLTDIGNKGLQAFSSAVNSTSNIDSVVQAANQMIATVVDSIKTETNYKKWRKLGKYLVEGFCEGITNNTWKAEAKAQAMADAAYEAAKNKLKINSPSKIFRSLGSGVVEGFVQGIDQNTYSAEKSSSSMAKSVIDSFSTSMQLANDVLEAESSLKPTIKPIVDLSEARNGAALLSSMFSSQNGVYSNVSAINRAMNGRVDMNAEIANGINQVREAINGINNESAMYTFTTNVDLDGREIARGTATYTQAELNKLQVRSNRKLGLV